LSNDCSNNLNYSDHMRFFAGQYGDHHLRKMERINCFICDDI